MLRVLEEGKPVDCLVGEGSAVLSFWIERHFMLESGGQAGDTGVLTIDSVRFVVEDTRKGRDAIVHMSDGLTVVPSSVGNDCIGFCR